MLTTDGSGCPFGVAMSLTSQFVGQRWPFPMLKGRPEVIRNVPLTCQPPISASSSLFIPLPYFMPRPIGSLVRAVGIHLVSRVVRRDRAHLLAFQS